MRADCDHLAERLLATTKYQGFPVTRSDTDKILYSKKSQSLQFGTFRTEEARRTDRDFEIAAGNARMRADCDHLAERLLATTKYQGFPVTRSDTDKTLRFLYSKTSLGYCDSEHPERKKLDAPIAISRSRREMCALIATTSQNGFSPPLSIRASPLLEAIPTRRFWETRASCPVKEGTVCPFA
jgi:hypothetical protein